jgi:uncharacterized protein involved in type VI secretion and phage assembly
MRALIGIQAQPGAARAFYGLHAGRVADVQDPEQLGRIKVSVPSVFGAESAESQTWARPCFPVGHFFMPDVDDRVWVAFEHGDPTAPVWLGEWYAAGATPPEATASPPAKRVIRTASGHRILLDDTSGSEKVVLEDAAGSRIELSADGMLLHAAGDLTIEAPGKTIFLKAASVDVQSSP